MGAHVPRLACATPLLRLALVLVLVFSFLVLSFGAALPSDDDADALLRFKESIPNANVALSSWNSSSAPSPCTRDRPNWIGVLCVNGRVWGLQLEHMALQGTINVDALAALPYFRTLSLMDNQFEGPLPDFRKITSLKALYLSNNLLSGDIPNDAFQGMGSLKRLFLANNEFTGNIPYCLTTLPRLAEVRLEGNQFQGQIPEFYQRGIKINLASNELEGQIPISLSKLSPTSFSGNKRLCGPPLGTCVPLKEGNGALQIIIIVIVVLLIVAAIGIACCLLCSRRRNVRSELARSATLGKNSSKAEGAHGGEQGQNESVSRTTRRSEHGKLTFLQDNVEKFDLQDMLRASAEVLGSGTFGASYKAVMNGTPLVVKRYRHMNNVGREDFQEHMRRIGRLKHPNLLPLMAFYYRKEEKLLISEFVENGCLASHLHGNKCLEDQGGLDWKTRLKIVKGVARGLAYLYSALPIVSPHGHIKSSNVLLNKSFEPLLTDYALRPVINPEHAHMLMIAYKSPEYAKHGKICKSTDVWSFGILILEILTGKFPENCLTQGYDSNSDLATWVNNMVKQKKTSEVFDKEMQGTKNSKREMLNLLRIALSCCEEDAERRMDIKEVVDKIEELKEGDDDEDHNNNNNNNIFGQGNANMVKENEVSEGMYLDMDR